MLPKFRDTEGLCARLKKGLSQLCDLQPPYQLHILPLGLLDCVSACVIVSLSHIIIDSFPVVQHVSPWAA